MSKRTTGKNQKIIFNIRDKTLSDAFNKFKRVNKSRLIANDILIYLTNRLQFLQNNRLGDAVRSAVRILNAFIEDQNIGQSLRTLLMQTTINPENTWDIGHVNGGQPWDILLTYELPQNTYIVISNSFFMLAVVARFMNARANNQIILSESVFDESFFVESELLENQDISELEVTNNQLVMPLNQAKLLINLPNSGFNGPPVDVSVPKANENSNENPAQPPPLQADPNTGHGNPRRGPEHRPNQNLRDVDFNGDFNFNINDLTNLLRELPEIRNALDIIQGLDLASLILGFIQGSIFLKLGLVPEQISNIFQIPYNDAVSMFNNVSHGVARTAGNVARYAINNASSGIGRTVRNISYNTAHALGLNRISPFKVLGNKNRHTPFQPSDETLPAPSPSAHSSHITDMSVRSRSTVTNPLKRAVDRTLTFNNPDRYYNTFDFITLHDLRPSNDESLDILLKSDLKLKGDPEDPIIGIRTAKKPLTPAQEEYILKRERPKYCNKFKPLIINTGY